MFIFNSKFFAHKVELDDLSLVSTYLDIFIICFEISDAEGRTYLFDLDFNSGAENPYTVDAANFGNVSHFVNHSCDPNLAVFNVWIDCLHPDLPRLAMFAVRDIIKGEQLTFDYRQRTGDDNEEAETEGEETEEGGMECRCGSSKCRKIMFH